MADTFLITDIAGSTRLWEEHPQSMGEALAAHDRVIDEAVTSVGGRVFKHTGDGMAAVFADPLAAVKAASRIHERLGDIPVEGVGSLSVRIGIHTGEAEERDGDYFGLAVSRTARLMDAGHGGQILCSSVTGRLVEDAVRLVDLGEHRLRDLTSPERIYQLAVDGAGTTFPRLRTLDVAPNNLPHFPTSFVGRHEEQQELAELISNSRLVTITGVGGAGKTRLALQVAADLVPRFPAGVWLAELATVTDPDALDAAVMATLGLGQPSGSDPRRVIMEHLAGKEALLVVDNCEHLIDAAASLVAEILAAAPEVKVVATSRELLGVSGEVSYRLRSLTVPGRDVRDLVAARATDAVGLFVERATTGRPDFQLTDDNASTVADICRRLDGMPLAIELAAARLRSFSVDQIAAHLDQRFRLLTGGARTALPRQQTLTAAIDWSYRLLEEAEKAMFRRLSIFSGGFTYEAVEEVCPGDPVGRFDVLELLPNLVDKSLVVADEADGEVRYRLLETLRQFARDRLDEEGDAETWRERHARHYARLSDADMRRRAFGPHGPEVRRLLRAESSNLRRALDWALGIGESELVFALFYSLARVFGMDGRWSELLAWSEMVGELVDSDTPLRLRAQWMASHGTALYYKPDHEGAVEMLGGAADILRRLDEDGADPDTLIDFPRVLNNLGFVLLYTGRGGERNEVYTELQHEVLDVARRLGDEFWEAVALANLAHHRDPGGDPVRARGLFEEAEAAARRVGPDRLAGLADQRAYFEFSQGEIAEACRRWAEASRLAEEVGDPQSAAASRLARAAGRVEQGDLEAAEDFQAAVVQLLADPEVERSRAFHQTVLVFGAGVDAAFGRLERVASAAGVSETLADGGLTVRWDLLDYFEGIKERARQELGEERYEEIRSQSAARPDDELAALVGNSTEPTAVLKAP